MDVNTESPNGAPEDAHGMTQEQAVEQTPEDVVKYDTYRKVMSQRYKLKEERDELQKRLEAIETERLQEQGKYREQAEIYKKKADEYAVELDKIKKQKQFDHVSSVIKSKLADKGVRNPEKAFKYAQAVNRDDLGRIVLTEDGAPDQMDVDRFVDKFLNDNVDMNFVAKPGVNDMTPTNDVDLGNKPKATPKLSKEELDAAWENLK